MSTTELLDPTVWWANAGVAGAAECKLSYLEQGAAYDYQLRAVRGIDHDGDAKRVAQYWESLGMAVWITDTPHPTVFGEGGPTLRASFDTGGPDHTYEVGAVAPCSPGDWFELNEEDEAARDRGEMLPGDDVPLGDDGDPRRTPTPTPAPSDQ